METEIKIKYIKGLPTLKCIRELTMQFFGEKDWWKVSTGTYWKGNGACLLWSRDGLNERMDEFAGFLKEYGIDVGELRLYESPKVGSLEIKNRLK